MPPAPLPPNEPRRLKALHSLGVLDTPAEQQFDDLTRLASYLCQAPIALISLIDADRQWFKSKVGLTAEQTPRDQAFCAHAIHGLDIFEVPDATADPRFADNPLVTGDPNIRFYAGAPLATPDGYALGTLCVIDGTRRTLGGEQREHLKALARLVTSQLLLGGQVERLERTAAASHAQSARFHAIIDSMFEFVGLLSPDGIVLEANRAAVEAVGLTPSDVVGIPFADTVWWAHSAVEREKLSAAIRRAAGGEFVRFETSHPLADGTTAAIDFSLTPVRDHRGTVQYLVPEGRAVSELKRVQSALHEQEAQFRRLVEASPIGIYRTTPDGRILLANPAAVRLAGAASFEALAERNLERDGPQCSYPRAEFKRRLETDGEVSGLETEWVRPDGRRVYLRENARLVREESGAVYYEGTLEDVTERKWAEDALRESEQRFRRVVDELAEGVVLLDAASRVVLRANAAFLDLLGYTADEAVALSQSDFVAHDLADIDAELMTIERQGRLSIGLRRYKRKGGTTVDVSVSGSALTLDGRPVLCLVVRDMTEQVRYEEQLVRYQCELEESNARLQLMATTDALTGVRNRAAFNDRLQDEYDRAVRHERPLSIVLLDVDHFKQFNDAFGHPAGDQVLKEVAATLQEVARTTDCVARYGGEEFALLLPETDYAGGMVLAERCRRAIAGRSWDKRVITVSVGVATLDGFTSDAWTLVKLADDALYQSKRAGRNRVSHGSGSIPFLATVRA